MAGTREWSLPFALSLSKGCPFFALRPPEGRCFDKLSTNGGATAAANERECMSWEKEVEELKRRQKLAEGMGGAEKLKRQKDGGKLNVRERIAALVDKGSFREIGKLGGVGQYDAKGNLASFLPANILFGRAHRRAPHCRSGRRFHRTRRGGGCLAPRQAHPVGKACQRISNAARPPH